MQVQGEQDKGREDCGCTEGSGQQHTEWRGMKEGEKKLAAPAVGMLFSSAPSPGGGWATRRQEVLLARDLVHPRAGQFRGEVLTTSRRVPVPGVAVQVHVRRRSFEDPACDLGRLRGHVIRTRAHKSHALLV